MKFFVYMDTITFIGPDAGTAQQVLSEVSRISAVLGLRVNKTKTEIYKWASSTTNETVLWEGVPHKVRPPILRYLGHLMAHPPRAHKARGD